VTLVSCHEEETRRCKKLQTTRDWEEGGFDLRKEKQRRGSIGISNRKGNSVKKSLGAARRKYREERRGGISSQG